MEARFIECLHTFGIHAMYVNVTDETIECDINELPSLSTLEAIKKEFDAVEIILDHCVSGCPTCGTDVEFSLEVVLK